MGGRTLCHPPESVAHFNHRDGKVKNPGHGAHMMRAAWVAIPVLLAVAVLTAAVPPGTYQDVEETSCWECHAPGLWDPEMVEPRVREYRFDPTPDGWVLSATVENPWLHDLQRVAGLVVMPHEGLRHAGGNSSLETHRGTMEVMPGSSGAAVVSIQVPEGTQRLVIRAQAEGLMQHEVDMTVYPGSDTDEGESWGFVQRNGSYEEARFGPDALGAAGWGEWTVAIRLDEGLGLPEDVDYTVEVESHGDPGRQPWLAISEETVAPHGEVTLTWPVSVGDDGAQQEASLHLLTDMHYRHDDASIENLAHAVTSLEFPVQVRGGSPLFIEEEPEEEDRVTPGVPAAALLAALLGTASIRRR